MIDGVTAFEVSANGEKALYKPGRQRWFAHEHPRQRRRGVRRAERSTAAYRQLRLRPSEGGSAQDRRHGSLRRSAGRMEADVPRSLAAAARLPLRPQLPRLRPGRRREEVRARSSTASPTGPTSTTSSTRCSATWCSATPTSAAATRPKSKRVTGGLLGADFTIDNGRYRFARVFTGENWNPQLRAPLTQPGVNVKEGEYLLAVNGKELKATDNLYKAFEATAGKAIIIKVGPNPDGKDAREVTVVPVESETGLRNLAWIEDNRRKVDQMTGGKVAYVYLPDTGFGGYTNFNRYFFAQVDKQAVVLDERFNGGGKAADYIIDYLRRPLLNYWTARDGKIYTTPGGAIFGPKAMIINEFAGSGGDAMPWYFRQAKLGPLVGKRTWGGLVGISGYPPLLDGGLGHRPQLRVLQPRRHLGRGEQRRRPGRGGRARPLRSPPGPRPAARKGGRSGA